MSAPSRSLATAMAHRPRGGQSLSASDIRDHATFGASVVALYIFLLNSRVLDVSIAGYFHIPLMLLVSLMLMTLAKGDLQYAFKSKITKYFAGFTIWVLVAYPFSKWRGGSMQSVQWQLQAMVIFLIIVQLVRSRRDWEKIATAYAYATLVGSLLTFVMGVSIEGRIAVFAGSLGDPNTLAIFLVVGLPYWWLKAARASGAKRILFLACTLPIYLAIARAGSRSGMLALAALMVATFFFANGGRKMLICMGVGVGMLVAFAILPDYLKARYFTFFSGDTQVDQKLSHDIASSEARKTLLIQSINMTFRHPLVGVGPGIFPWIGFEERKVEYGSGGLPFQSHNTYTQISSETGLPGFFFFAGSMFFCLRAAFQAYRRLKNIDPFFSVCGRYMVSSIAALAMGIFFLSVGYTYLVSITFALCASLEMMVVRYVAQHAEDAKQSASGTPVLDVRSRPTAGSALPSRTPAVQPVLPAPAQPRRRPLRARLRTRPVGSHLYPDHLKG